MENGYSASDKEDLDTLFVKRTKTFRNKRAHSFDALSHARVHPSGDMGQISVFIFLGTVYVPLESAFGSEKSDTHK